MLNWIWLGLVLLGVLIGGITGRIEAVTAGAFDGAKKSVEIAIGFIGFFALWLGLMRLAERAGMVSLLARGLRPVTRRLFPDVPPDHPAIGSMLLNMSANMLGLSNAATPLGLRAMRDLEKLNPHPGTATNSMVTFLAINTASIQLIPASAIAVLASKGAAEPTAIIGTALAASACATTAAIVAAKFFERLPAFRPPPPTPAAPAEDAGGAPAASGEPEPAAARPLTSASKVLVAALLLFFAGVALSMVLPEWFGLPAGDGRGTAMQRIVGAASKIAIPLLVSLLPLYAALKGIKVYEEFVTGAKEGFDVAVRVIPYLVAILAAVGMFRGAGGIEMIAKSLGPALAAVGFPVDLLPVVLMRPLSGSGTMGLFVELVDRLGPDHLHVRMAATIFGSTETTFYVIAVYFGSVAVKRTRHAIPAGLIADTVSFISSIVICRAVFG